MAQQAVRADQLDQRSGERGVRAHVPGSYSAVDVDFLPGRDGVGAEHARASTG